MHRKATASERRRKPARRQVPVHLWFLTNALWRRGHPRAALLVKKINSVMFHNSLSPGSRVSPDFRFEHHGFGTVIHSNVDIGLRVRIWHNVTIAVRAASDSPHRIVIEDGVKIGANSVIISPAKGGLRIGRGAVIGAGAVVSHDVPPGATVVSAAPRVIMRDSPATPGGGDGGGARGDDDPSTGSSDPASDRLP